MSRWFVAVCLMVVLPLSGALAQSETDFKPGHPDRYVVQEGDTLWDIANKFLLDPWRWPLIWQENAAIENPHLIFPGDLLVVTSDHHIKVVRLEPKVHVQPLERAVPTIPPHIIYPFLTAASIVDPGELDQAGHVLSGVEDELVLGKYQRFYARGLVDDTADEYQLFRIGKTLTHPESGELLGIEGIHLGEARMERRGDDVSKLLVTGTNQEIRPSDKLLPITEVTPLPYYQPHSPETNLTGIILMAPKGVFEVGKFDVVIITGGTREGLEEGHVLLAMYHRGERTDPVTGENYEVPDEISGIMMVFRTFEKLSYALILKSVRSISVGDRYESPPLVF